MLAAKADPNGDINSHLTLNLTPLQTAVQFDRDDIEKALIGAGAVV